MQGGHLGAAPLLGLLSALQLLDAADFVAVRPQLLNCFVHASLRRAHLQQRRPDPAPCTGDGDVQVTRPPLAHQI